MPSRGPGRFLGAVNFKGQGSWLRMFCHEPGKQAELMCSVQLLGGKSSLQWSTAQWWEQCSQKEDKKERRKREVWHGKFLPPFNFSPSWATAYGEAVNLSSGYWTTPLLPLDQLQHLWRLKFYRRKLSCFLNESDQYVCCFLRRQ